MMISLAFEEIGLKIQDSKLNMLLLFSIRPTDSFAKCVRLTILYINFTCFVRALYIDNN